MTCVIVQPSYIPWRGFFDLMSKADVFVFYDCVQYDDHGWRNRNRIKTGAGLQWLTIPVYSKGAHTQAIPIKDGAGAELRQGAVFRTLRADAGKILRPVG